MTVDGEAIEVKLQFSLRHPGAEDAIDRTAIFQSPAANWSRGLLEAELERGAREVVELMLLDLRDHRTIDELSSASIVLETRLDTNRSTTTDAFELGQSAEQEITYYRLKNGNLYALARNQPLRLHRTH